MSLSSFLHPVFSQAPASKRIAVSGIVKDSAGVGMPGVTVAERGRNNATTTVADGGFSLSVSSTKSVLVFSSVGYANKELQVGNNTTFTVSLAQGNSDD